MADGSRMEACVPVPFEIRLERAFSHVLPVARRKEIEEIYKIDQERAFKEYIEKRGATFGQIVASDLPEGPKEKHRKRNRLLYEKKKDTAEFKEKRHACYAAFKERTASQTDSAQQSTEDNNFDTGIDYPEPENSSEPAAAAVQPLTPPVSDHEPPTLFGFLHAAPDLPEPETIVQDEPLFLSLSDSDAESLSDDLEGRINSDSSDEDVTDSDIELDPLSPYVLCSGHDRDKLQLVCPHKPRLCEPTGNEYRRDQPIPIIIDSLSSLLPQLHAKCKEIIDSTDDDPGMDFESPNTRSENIKNAELNDTILHVVLPRGRIRNRQDFNEVVADIIGVVKEYWKFQFFSSDAHKHSKTRGGNNNEETVIPTQQQRSNEHEAILDSLPSHIWSPNVRKGNLTSYNTSYMCDYEKHFRDHKNNRSKTSRSRANCEGKITVKYVIPTHTIAVRLTHRPHRCLLSTLGFSEQAVIDFVESIREKKGLEILTGSVIRTWANFYIHPKAGAIAYELHRSMLQDNYMHHEIDMISVIILAEKLRSRYGLFVFYSGPKTGIAVFSKDIIAKGAAATTELSLDATYGTNKHKLDLLIATGCIDRTGVIMAEMWIIDTAKLTEYLLSQHYAIFSAEKPLYQCPIAAQIDEEVAKTNLVDDNISGVTACFLSLLYRGASPSPANDASSGVPDAVENPEYLSTAHRNPIVGDAVLEAHQFPGLRSLRTVLTDKHKATMKASEHVMKHVSIHFCLWHVKDAVRRHVMHAQFFKMIYKSLRDRKLILPPIFDKYVPFMSQKALLPHGPTECAAHLGVGQEDASLCILHSTRLEEHFDQPMVLFDKVNKSRLRVKANLLHMLSRHARSHPTIPRGFTGIGIEYEQCRYYSAEELASLCQEEMISFCASEKLYANLIYLWVNWYNPSSFPLWTMVYAASYLNPVTNMLAEGQKSKVKSTVRATSNTRLDEFLYLYDTLLYDDYHRRAVVLSKAVLESKYTTIHLEFRILWVERRRFRFNHMVEDKNEDDETSEVYLDELMKYGTDALNFVCGCEQYSHYNMHICRHIMNAISHACLVNYYSQGIRYTTRSSDTVPYFSNAYNGGGVKKATWTVQYTTEYMEFYQSIGKELLESFHPLYPQIELIRDPEPSQNGPDVELQEAEAAPSIESLRASRDRLCSFVNLTAGLPLLEHPDAGYIRAGFDKQIAKVIKIYSALVDEEEIDLKLAPSPTARVKWRYPQHKKIAASIDPNVRREIIRQLQDSVPLLSGDLLCPEHENLKRRIDAVIRRRQQDNRM